MKKWSVNELREVYLSYFESKEHLRLPSFSLIPNNDKSLLLINSGMAPLKPYFTGQEKPPRKRVTTCQKCIRTGDIDNIGHTARHGTFFEMLGNFSFGDYFKKEAINFSWEFLTVTLGIDPNRLYPSVYEGDDEAYDLWHDYIGVPSERIFKFGKADNFWEHGEGPCGPCSEIYYDRGEKYGCKKETCTVGCDCDRYMEIWNNVFTQFNNDGKGNYTELNQKNIDTGMGLERLAVVMQDVESIFEVDTNKELMDHISILTSHIYKEDEIADISLRIIADHIKSCTFMISDGILPSNEGRGYVLRRLLRRAVQHGRKLGIKKIFMPELAKTIIKLNSEHYTELNEKKEMILKVLNAEEEKFLQTLDQGLQVLNEYIDDLKKNNKKILSGENAFRLYDTFGFPIDITKEILNEEKMILDEEVFNQLMLEQKNRARDARKVSNYMGQDATAFDALDKNITTDFVGYDKLEIDANIISISNNNQLADTINEGDEAIIITDKTTFYPMMGGQVGDKGIIKTDSGLFIVDDTIKILNTKIGHIGKVKTGYIKVNEKATLIVDNNIRHKTAINHSATHLLHAALKKVLGEHVNQAGSLVDSDKLRFDFTHFNQLTEKEISDVEKLVNDEINQNIDVIKKEMKLQEAKKEGATALFGEKYGEVVRTVKMSDFSFELCGGTHIDNTNEIKFFKIISEESVAQGVRRIEAVTYDKVIDYYKQKDNILKIISDNLKTNDNSLVDKVLSLIKETKELKIENDKLKKELSNISTSNIEFEKVNDLNVVIKSVSVSDIKELKDMSDTIKNKINDSVIVLGAIINNTPQIIVSLSDTAVKKGLHAGNIIKQVCKLIEGAGGGKDKFAQAGGKDASKLEEAIKSVKLLI